MIRKNARFVEIGKNFGLRLISAFLSTGVRQFITLPVLAAIFSKEAYGTILTINSIANITEVSLGNTLNNTRMVSNSEYEEKGFTGDFNCFVVIASAIGTLCAILMPFVFPGIDLLTGVLLWLVILAGIMNGYYIVGFTMRLMFDKVLIQSLIVAGGTLIGVGLTKVTGLWPFSFLMGNIAGLCFLYLRSPLMRERMAWTPLAKKTAKKWSVLSLTSLLSNAMIYLDRLLLYPIVGAAAVAIYTTASFFGKCVAALIPSASNVLLAYFSQKNYRMTKSAFLKIVALSIAFCGLCYLISVPFAPWITRLLYPSLFGEANSLLLLANAAAMIAAAGTLAQTIVLRFCKTTKLLYVQIMYSVVYLGGGLAVLGTYGIMGFCWVAIAANLVRLIALILYGYTGIVQQKDR